MYPLLTPKLDFIFKKLLCDDTEILTNLINSVLQLPIQRRIRSVQIKNPIILPEEITQKYIILDILATDESERTYEIEMQVRQHADYSRRSLYYVSKLYAGQLNSGENYGELKPVIGIHFLDYEEFSDYDDFHFQFELRDICHPELRLTDDMVIHIFELPKFGKTVKTGHPEGAMREWLHFFNHAHEEDETMRTNYRNPAIRKAFAILEILSADQKTRLLAEMREKALRNERSELAAARKKGLEEGIEKGATDKAKETAETLLKMGVLSTEQISQATGLSVKEIRKLQKNRDSVI
jgi:predicted transposase/invertase (TIGR01784 family)